MEFMSKRDRLILTAVSQAGPAGVELTSLFTSLSPFLTRESVMKGVEELLLKDLIKINNLGQGEIRYVASKQVRDAMINLDIAKLRVVEYIKELNAKKDEILKIQDKNQQVEELKKVVSEGLLTISSGILSLLNSMPELTIPEYIEAIQPLAEILEKLYKVVEKPYTKEETEAIIKIIEKYRGEKDSKLLKEILEKAQSPQK
mgnify:CR=1 FL=1